MRAVSGAWRRVSSFKVGETRGAQARRQAAPRTAGSHTHPSTLAARCGGRSAGSGGRSPCRCGTWRARSNGRAQSAARWRGLPRAGSGARSPVRIQEGMCGLVCVGGDLCGDSCRALKWREMRGSADEGTPARGRSETPRRRPLWARGPAAPAAATRPSPRPSLGGCVRRRRGRRER